jgi:hypothetical protein
MLNQMNLFDSQPPINLISSLLLSSHFLFDLTNELFTSSYGFSTKPLCIFLFPHAFHVPRPSVSPLIDNSNVP